MSERLMPCIARSPLDVLATFGVAVSRRGRPFSGKLWSAIVWVLELFGKVERSKTHYPFPATTLSIRSDTNTASHRSRWFQRFGTIPGSLDIYYAIYAR